MKKRQCGQSRGGTADRGRWLRQDSGAFDAALMRPMAARGFVAPRSQAFGIETNFEIYAIRRDAGVRPLQPEHRLRIGRGAPAF
jgi:hypothetical protein